MYQLKEKDIQCAYQRRRLHAPAHTHRVADYSTPTVREAPVARRCQTRACVQRDCPRGE